LRPRLVAALFALLLGAAIARVPLGGAYRAEPIRMWLADRADHALLGVSAELLVERRFELPAPTRLAVVEDCLWVASATHGSAFEPHTLYCLSAATGEVLARFATGPLRELVPSGSGIVAWEHDADGDRLVRFERAGRGAQLDLAGVSAVAAHSGGLCVATDAGVAWLLDRDLAVRDVRCFDAPLRCVAASSAALWLADVEGNVLRVDSGLRTRVAATLPWEIGWIAASPDGDALVLARDGPHAARVAGTGAVTPLVVPTRGLVRARCGQSGRAWIIAPGVLLQLRGEQLELGQGGFAYLSDITLVTDDPPTQPATAVRPLASSRLGWHPR